MIVPFLVTIGFGFWTSCRHALASRLELCCLYSVNCQPCLQQPYWIFSIGWQNCEDVVDVLASLRRVESVCRGHFEPSPLTATCQQASLMLPLNAVWGPCDVCCQEHCIRCPVLQVQLMTLPFSVYCDLCCLNLLWQLAPCVSTLMYIQRTA